MPKAIPARPTPEWIETASLIASDAERLVSQHAALIAAEAREGVRDATTSAGAMAAGSGLLAFAGVLAAHAAVHGLHRASRLPLWACYGLGAGAMAAGGAGLIATGVRRLSTTNLVPRETIAALREDMVWLKEHLPRSAGEDES